VHDDEVACYVREITDAESKECVNSAECKGPKSHYDHCAHRVEEQIEKFGKPKEDCVEECEFFVRSIFVEYA
jgi:hypothetical protein